MDVQIFDNGGKTRDRYCVIIDNQKVYAMTGDPLMPRGIRYLCEVIDLDREEAGKSVDLKDLPKEVKKAIRMYVDTWVEKAA